MNNSKMIHWLGVVVFFASFGRVEAQTFAIPFSLNQSSPAVTFSLDTYGILLSSGTENGTAVLSTGEQGAGTRLLWYPGKAALRAGGVSGTQWNDANIGAYSVAFGQNSAASGANSFAMGSNSTASGDSAVALSGGSAGSNSLAFGYSVNASGGYSEAFGVFTSATGGNSLAAGAGCGASGQYSIAMGLSAHASGYASACFNDNAVANSFCSTSFGILNVGLSSNGATPSATNWVPTDPLFEIGNGSFGTFPAPTVYSDALVVYKNGNTVIQGTLTVHTSGGDIPMYTGN